MADDCSPIEPTVFRPPTAMWVLFDAYVARAWRRLLAAGRLGCPIDTIVFAPPSIHFVMNSEGGYAFRHGRNRRSRALAEAKQDDGHGSPKPKSLLAGETATTREPKAWSWDNLSFYHYFPRYPQFLSTSIWKGRLTASKSRKPGGIRLVWAVKQAGRPT
jgi:hypothetical protein